MADPWRYRCPNGHASWESHSMKSTVGPDATAEYYCQQCGHFDELVDMKKEHAKSE